MAIHISERETDPVRINQAIRQLIQGRGDFVGDVTLAAGATTTVVSFPNCSSDSHVFLEPQTANAAAARATTYIKRVDIAQGMFTITHANAVSLDRTFSFACIGG